MSKQSYFKFDYNLHGEGPIVYEEAENPYINEFLDQVQDGLISEPGSYNIEVIENNGKFTFKPKRISHGKHAV